MSSSDDSEMSSDGATNSPQQPAAKRDGPFSSLCNGYVANKFDRPLPVKEDLIAYVDAGRTRLGYVSKVGYKDDRSAAESDCQAGTFFHVDEIPSLKLAYVAGTEAITVDRCFSVGETVMAFKNRHEGTPQASNRCHKMSMIGQITDVRTTADVIVLPDKNTILKDVPIDNFKTLDMMNYNSSHNYVFYKDWIGDIVEMENEIVCKYFNQKVTIIESSRQESYFRRKGEHHRSNKSFVPGETVYVELRHLSSSRHAKWEGGVVPPNIKKKMSKAFACGDQKMRLIIENIIPVSVGVKWIHSPSTTVQPEKKITKEHLKDLISVDVSANQRVSSADRMVFDFTDQEVRKMSKKEYNQWMTNEYKSWFTNPKTVNRKKEEAVGSTLKPVKEEDEDEMKSEKDEEETMEVEEQTGTGDHAKEEEEDEDEEEEEPPTRSTRQSTSTRGSTRLKRGRKTARGRNERKKKTTTTQAVSLSKPEVKKREGKWIKGTFIAEVLISHTVCDVEWMDGSVSKDVLGASLVPIDPDLDQQDHLPGNLVAKKNDGEDQMPDDEVFGVILRVNVEERVATVRWFKLLDRTRANGGAEQMEDEEVTLFDIKMHPYYKRQFPGYLGISISKTDAMGHEPDLKKTCCKIMANLQNGKQLVEYFDKTTEELWPMEIMAVFLHDHEDDGESFTDEPLDWTANEEQSIASSTAATAGTAVSTASTHQTLGILTSLSSPLEYLDLPSSSRGPARNNERTTRSSAKKKKKNEEDELELIPKSLPMFEKGTLTMLDGEVNINHKYLADPVVNPGRPWIKAVMREHAHLKEHLPKEIHLWAWETRLDLLTLVIFGPSGTPFELTPFHFDIHIPDTFPATPPKVHFYAWSQEQLNPNLYQAGKVCVSLLGTWDGDAAEKWTPTSNLLQVFISIQGLILNAEPYFNEAGYEERKNLPEHEANSKRYNETATINSLEYMWRIYDKPHAHIASVVRQGVDAGLPDFKKKVMAWADGKKQPEFPVHGSKGFKLALKTSMNKIVSIVNKHQIS